MSELEPADTCAFQAWRTSTDHELWGSTVVALTGRLADLPMPESTGAWDGRDSADVVSDLREDLV